MYSDANTKATYKIIINVMEILHNLDAIECSWLRVSPRNHTDLFAYDVWLIAEAWHASQS